MSMPPTGTVTFLFTDVVGSTHRWDAEPETMKQALVRHDAIVREAIERHGGHIFKTVGDAFHAAFATPGAALNAAVAAQRTLAEGEWGGAVRMALHTGVADERDDDYFGPTLNRVARLRDAAHGGQILLSAVTAGLVRGQVPDGIELRDLGTHRLRDISEPEQVYQAAVWGLPADFPPLRTDDEPRSVLPRPLTSFVGRERELEEVARLLERARLVTLTGPGGTGKTRLALAVAERVRDRYPDGVWFVDLSAIAEPGLVASAIAQVLGVREGEGQSLASVLTARLRERQVLLVLDNFEQVVEAASLVGELLTETPRLTLLATSRVVLRLSGEHVYPVAPLAVPDPNAPAAVIATAPAVTLFVERARQARPDFALTNANAAAVAEICARLDGLPLAIELAAARIRLLSPVAIRHRLGERLALLTGGSRDLPQRQQTLRDALRWSYDLLPDAEQMLFRRLSVFAGGWTRESAAAICRARSDPDIDLLDGLALLADKSLVRQQDWSNDDPRFTMLETIREFGLEQLGASGEADACLERHAAYFLALAERAEPDLFLVDHPTPTLKRMEQDHANLRAALDWAIRCGERDLAVRLAAALGGYWFSGGYLSEGRHRLEAAVAETIGRPSLARAQALYVLGRIGGFQEGYARWVWAFEESRDLYRQFGDLAGVARCLNSLGRVLLDRGDVTQAMTLFRESLALFREGGNRAGMAWSLSLLGDAAQAQGELERAADLVEESLALQRSVGDPSGIANALAHLGMVRQAQRDDAQAAQLFEQSLALYRAAEDRTGLAGTLLRLGTLLSDRGDLDRAAPLLAESLTLSRKLGTPLNVAHCLLRFSELAGRLDRPAQAALLLGAGKALLAKCGTPLPVRFRGRYARALNLLRAKLGEDAFTGAYEAGRALSLDDAVALALEQIDTESPSDT
jgi:predicted ATPase/class 3 adenylate cyclase